jgi:hypothetical protein|tara:strand:- start:715 stop:960 length:246 start_codon:yes stop_codon:yes gene_type:complete
MKYALYMILCSALAGECMPPHKMPTTYDSMFSCLNAGYEESLKKSKEVGREEVNQHHIYIKFVCKEIEEIIVPQPKPKIEA